ncbi:hypothetical protein D3C71_2044090 [compost metagenome]
MVGAPNGVSLDMAFAQRHRSVAATIHQRADHPGLPAKENNRLVQVAACEAFSGFQIGRERGHVPHVAQEHSCLLLQLPV